MTEPTRRPILSLKSGVKAPLASPAPLSDIWKCKPCGAPLALPATWAEGDVVRCPNCNAKIGLAADLARDPPELDKVRARRAAPPPPPPPPVPEMKPRRVVRRP